MARKAAMYARVSTNNGQTPENQLAQLRDAAAKAGWQVVGEFVDQGISGAKGRDKRPAFDRLCKATTRREVDVVMAWSVDRLGRSLQDLVVFLGDLQASGVDLYLHKQGVDTTTPGGKALFQMIAESAAARLFRNVQVKERYGELMAPAIEATEATVERVDSVDYRAPHAIAP